MKSIAGRKEAITHAYGSIASLDQHVEATTSDLAEQSQAARRYLERASQFRAALEALAASAQTLADDLAQIIEWQRRLCCINRVG